MLYIHLRIKNMYRERIAPCINENTDYNYGSSSCINPIKFQVRNKFIYLNTKQNKQKNPA